MSQGFTKEYPQPATGSMDVFVNGTYTATTSGTSYTFSIPSGVKRFSMSLAGVSTTSTGYPRIRLGDSGGLVTDTTKYSEGGAQVAGSSAITGYADSGFLVYSVVNTDSIGGTIDFTLVDAGTNVWAASGVYADKIGGIVGICAGTVVLPGELTQVGIDVANTGSFDSGAVNIQYENPSLVGGDTVYVEGGVVQTVNTHDGSVATGTTTIPNDDTVPQNTEGTEFMTCSITPTSTTNLLRIDVVAQSASSVATGIVNTALFKDSDSDALACMPYTNTAANARRSASFTYWMTAGSTSSMTFKVRIGQHVAGTVTFNGSAAGGLYGGTLASTITITEYAV